MMWMTLPVQHNEAVLIPILALLCMVGVRQDPSSGYTLERTKNGLDLVFGGDRLSIGGQVPKQFEVTLSDGSRITAAGEQNKLPTRIKPDSSKESAFEWSALMPALDASRAVAADLAPTIRTLEEHAGNGVAQVEWRSRSGSGAPIIKEELISITPAGVNHICFCQGHYWNYHEEQILFKANNNLYFRDGTSLNEFLPKSEKWKKVADISRDGRGMGVVLDRFLVFDSQTENGNHLQTMFIYDTSKNRVITIAPNIGKYWEFIDLDPNTEWLLFAAEGGPWEILSARSSEIYKIPINGRSAQYWKGKIVIYNLDKVTVVDPITRETIASLDVPPTATGN